MGNDPLDKILETHGLTEAEKITGKSYKKDDETMKLGFMLHMLAGEQKKRALTERGDSHYNHPYQDHLDLIENYGGFELVFEEDYKNDRGDVENMRAYCHREKAIFWWVNSYTSNYPEGSPPKINHSGIDFYLRYAGDDGDEDSRLPVSASWSPLSKRLWDTLGPCGHMHLDGREAIRHKLQKVEASEWAFMVPWPETNKTHFTNSYDTSGLASAHENDIKESEKRERRLAYDTASSTASLRRIAQLPRWVRDLCPFEPYNWKYVK